MSVIVKGMEMPKNCSDCSLNYDQMACKVTGTRWWSDTMVLMNFDSDKERLHDCPLIELPPHGRLIDKDKLRHDLFVNFNGERIPFYDCDNFPTKIAYRDLHSILAEQKTIIEAEGEIE